jgi:ABC-type antimicrobial peptide transport system permease subunit
VAAGAAVGVLAALLAGRLVEALLFRVSPRDPLVFGVVLAVILVVALAATLVPAFRAARVDPVEALRAD